MKRYLIEYSAGYDGGVFKSNLTIGLDGDPVASGNLHKIDQECRKVLGKMDILYPFIQIDSIELEGYLN